ncbi:hypothetical protein CRG98_033338 [Punica granatum]|uniref:Uncharacterized protein n=1 Tax=Punica granatum TaxID=22663 RepID=A0A2I0IQJ7_PUNGR|nr:hypothetical protein CRG98_033338 [Punica granatum]
MDPGDESLCKELKFGMDLRDGPLGKKLKVGTDPGDGPLCSNLKVGMNLGGRTPDRNLKMFVWKGDMPRLLVIVALALMIATRLVLEDSENRGNLASPLGRLCDFPEVGPSVRWLLFVGGCPSLAMSNSSSKEDCKMSLLRCVFCIFRPLKRPVRNFVLSMRLRSRFKGLDARPPGFPLAMHGYTETFSMIPYQFYRLFNMPVDFGLFSSRCHRAAAFVIGSVVAN